MRVKIDVCLHFHANNDRNNFYSLLSIHYYRTSIYVSGVIIIVIFSPPTSHVNDVFIIVIVTILTWLFVLSSFQTTNFPRYHRLSLIKWMDAVSELVSLLLNLKSNRMASLILLNSFYVCKARIISKRNTFFSLKSIE